MKNKLIKNTVSLYVMNISKILISLVTLPYLTRILSKDCYGIVSYVKAVMSYMQLIVDFGFILSGANDIIGAKADKIKTEYEIGDIFAAKLILAVFSLIVLIIFMLFIPILRGNIIYTLLSFAVVFLTCFLFDYFFMGIEEMQMLAAQYICMRTISTVLTFIFVRSDSDILWMPIFDIIGSIAAAILVMYELKKRKITVRFTNFKNILNKIKKSALYFVSDFATTAFGVLNTLIIGIYASEVQVAEWSLCLQMVMAVQAMYTPITNGIYPEMVKNKNINIIKKSLKIFMPIIFAGCIFTFFAAEYVLLIIGGEQYVNAAGLLRALIPVLFISFPEMLFGWPVLGALERVKETTITTVIAAVLQILGLILLIAINKFTLINIAFLRGITDLILFLSRLWYCIKFRKEFNQNV